MEKLVIDGGRPLQGNVNIHGSKNAALPILAACMMAEGTHVIENVPNLSDIQTMLQILRALGCYAEQHHDRVILDTTPADRLHIPEPLMRQMRASIFLMGPILARFGEVRIYQPGGCAIGERKIDLHLNGLRALGAQVEQTASTIVCRAERLTGAHIVLDFPSVGATENIMMAAVMAEGVTTIENAAREPEIVDLGHYLNAMGANITGAGTDKIMIRGVSKLRPGIYRIIPDRIIAGTLMVAAAVTKGDVTLHGVEPAHLGAVIHVLRRSGVQITLDGDIMNIRCDGTVKPVERVVTAPYPAFPTDLQSQIMVLLSMADGLSIVKETVFESRFRHVEQLNRMGAHIQVDLNSAFIRGVPRLYGATVEASDLRAGAALVIAGLAACGTTIVEQIHHIDRGYDHIEHIFGSLGARIERVAAVPSSELEYLS